MPNFDQKVHYIKGNPLEKTDLDRCKLAWADCAVILSNPFSPNPKQEDYINILSAFSAKRNFMLSRLEYGPKDKKVKEDKINPIRICLQINKPDHKNLFYSGLESKVRTD